MELEKISIDKIRMYENNTKEHPEWQVEEIIKSISAFGYKDPIALDENNVIIEGHGRYLALKRLDYEEVEILRINDLTEEQQKAQLSQKQMVIKIKVIIKLKQMVTDMQLIFSFVESMMKTEIIKNLIQKKDMITKK